MVNQSLLYLLESVLGPSHKKARNNYAFFCPFCKHRKPKLEIQLETNLKGENLWACWTCENFKGKKLINLFKKINATPAQIKQLFSFLTPSAQSERSVVISKLPQEFRALNLDVDTSSVLNSRALKYLQNRGLDHYDITKYNIGYCTEGRYSDRIIIPSYDELGQLNYFIARSIGDISSFKYLNPPIDKNIIFNEFFINFNLPIILCEGVFDALAIKRNAIPLLGKTINESLMKKIVTSQVKKIYICLDVDALKMAFKHVEMLLNNGKEVYLVELKDKDASQMGFFKFTEFIQQVMPITFEELLIKKLEYT